MKDPSRPILKAPAHPDGFPIEARVFLRDLTIEAIAAVEHSRKLSTEGWRLLSDLDEDLEHWNVLIDHAAMNAEEMLISLILSRHDVVEPPADRAVRRGHEPCGLIHDGKLYLVLDPNRADGTGDPMPLRLTVIPSARIDEL